MYSRYDRAREQRNARAIGMFKGEPITSHRRRSRSRGVCGDRIEAEAGIRGWRL